MRRKQQFEDQYRHISIWTSPILVISYFVMYSFYEIRSALLYFYQHGRTTFTLGLVLLNLWIVTKVDGPHQQWVEILERQIKWYGYWILLGVASSIGLGSGLHTFILFLGPYIAEVTLAAYDCGTTTTLVRNSSSYRLECHLSSIGTNESSLYLWPIYKCIAMETLTWGIGTALGELPPYFMARAVALSGDKDQELKKLETSLEKSCQDRTLKESISFLVYSAMKRMGFFGILLFASIPNPLFDLAGITCGHFLVPFSTFFGATLLGKAGIKSAIQAFIVILAFSHDTLSVFLESLESSIPTLHRYVSRFIIEQTRQLGKGDSTGVEKMNYFGIAWNSFLSLMIGYFVMSSIESLGLAFMKQQQHQNEIKHLQIQKNKTIPLD
ncbi:uncharacterized protein BX664DRAFT_321805 [Halteromyces radiatus]|uniref:uncharacterized protein n=1 Tax=Halteromyces radiatus TaxID=101107 RepID=UPI0022204F70|nr:uncharacterized protein BX664DRAFT_321805 [Halteromyces radiatus]KAI8099650.1 hypothetical protein BX664DRAFT_321805 [Halteromyces radiatus]